jgi:Ca-activated chloride channel family protein
MVSHRSLVSVVLGLFCLSPAWVDAQGLLIVENPHEQVRLPRPIILWPPQPAPRPTPAPMSYRIKELAIEARVIDQVAQVQVSQTFVNTGNQPMEVAFVFPLPYDGAIERMTLLIDGKEYPARLLSATEARRLYEDIVRKNRDPALLEWLGAGLFRSSVFPVPAQASRTFFRTVNISDVPLFSVRWQDSDGGRWMRHSIDVAKFGGIKKLLTGATDMEHADGRRGDREEEAIA